jgi:hypothetical protein
MKAWVHLLDMSITWAKAGGVSDLEVREELTQRVTSIEGEMIKKHGDLWSALKLGVKQ